MKLPVDQVIRLHKKTLDALAAHDVATCMDDCEYIQIVRVLISAAVAILVEDGESDAVVGQVTATLRGHVRQSFVSHCVQQQGEVSNLADAQTDCENLFDHLYQHGEYPDA
jgi:hypothetical protein